MTDRRVRFKVYKSVDGLWKLMDCDTGSVTSATSWRAAMTYARIEVRLLLHRWGQVR